MKTTTVDEKLAMEIVLGRADLSQRGYANLCSIMLDAGVQLPPWAKVMEFQKTLDVGPIDPIHSDDNSCQDSCQGYHTNLADTLQVKS